VPVLKGVMKIPFSKLLITTSRDSSVGIATGYSCTVGFRFPERATNLSLVRSVQTGSGFHPVGTGGYFVEDKAAGA
jgi:hypothetical protein